MTTTPDRTVYGYIRVSSTSTVSNGPAIAAQAAQLTRWATLRGLTITDLFVDDGVSGRSISRPGWDELTRSVQELPAHVPVDVIAVSHDRYARSPAAAEVLFPTLWTISPMVDICVTNMDGPIPRPPELSRPQTAERTLTDGPTASPALTALAQMDPTRKFLSDLMLLVASYERDMTVRRMAQGKLSAGPRSHGGGVPWGTARDADGTLILDPDRTSPGRRTVDRIRELREHGCKSPEIALVLSDEGYASSALQTPWTADRVLKIESQTKDLLP